jgi:hypothetical protein
VRARRISRPGDRTGEHTGKRRRRYGRAGVHTEHAWSRRVGIALEWQGGRRVSAHVQPARNFQGVSSAPGSAQHEQRVQDVSFASGWDSSSDSENSRAVEGSEEHFDESEHVIVRRSAVEKTCACGWRCDVRRGGDVHSGVTACGRVGAVALGTPRETWHGR